MAPPRSRISSAAAHEAMTVPRTSTASTRSSFSRGVSRAAGAGEDVGAGVVDPGVDPPEPLAQRRRQRLDIVVAADVGPQHLRAATERTDGGGGLLGSRGVSAIGDREVGAFAGAAEGDGAPDPARGPGDHRDFAVQPHAASPRWPSRANFSNPNISGP